MADKEKKKPSMFSSLRRNLVARPSVEETRPMLPPTPSRPSIVPSSRLPRPSENFEISLRDKTDATAKRGFRVQVPKKLLGYFLLVFVVLPLALFMYMEVHRVAASHGHEVNEKMSHHHFHHDVLSLLGAEDEDEENDVADALVTNDTVVEENGVGSGNATHIGGAPNLNSTVEGVDTLASNATGTVSDVAAANQTEVGADKAAVETEQEEIEESRQAEKRSLRKGAR